MDFTIQYFGEFDRLLYLESVDVNEMAEALERAREVLRARPQISESVIWFL